MRPASAPLSLTCLISGVAAAVNLCAALPACAASPRQPTHAVPPRLWSDMAAWLASPMTPAKFVAAAVFAAFVLYVGLKLFAFTQRARAKKKSSAQKEGPPPSIQDEVKSFFLRVQEAWDRRDLDALAAMTTPAMLAEVRDQAEESPEPSRTDIVWVKADLVSQAEKEGQRQAVVYFTLLLREDARQGDTVEVREIWRLTRPLSGGSWRLDSIDHVKG